MSSISIEKLKGILARHDVVEEQRNDILAAVEREFGHEIKDVKAACSKDLLERIRELEQECEQINAILIEHGQYVASAQMDDAVSGLHKTLSCWNEGIKW